MSNVKNKKIMLEYALPLATPIAQAENRLEETPEHKLQMERIGELLYKAYYRRIERYFSFRIFEKHEAEDLAQTVFLKIFASLRKGQWEGSGGICYIFTVARNTLIDYFRRRKHALVVSDELVEAFADSTFADDSIERTEQKELILSAMRDLRKEEVEAVILRFFSDMEYPAIAKIMKKKEEAVRQLVHRGIKALKAGGKCIYE